MEKNEYLSLERKYKGLQKCIEDFKIYDSKRKIYIQQLKNEIQNLKNKCINIHEDFDNYMKIVETSPGLITNPQIKAIRFEFLRTIKMLKKEIKKLNKEIQYKDKKIAELENVVIFLNSKKYG